MFEIVLNRSKPIADDPLAQPQVAGEFRSGTRLSLAQQPADDPDDPTVEGSHSGTHSASAARASVALLEAIASSSAAWPPDGSSELIVALTELTIEALTESLPIPMDEHAAAPSESAATSPPPKPERRRFGQHWR